MQMAWSSTLVSYPSISQRVEDVRTLAGQTVTLSFWAKSTSNVNINTTINQNFGSGGSATVSGSVSTFAVTGSWQRFVYTTTLGSMSGKTIGTNSYLEVTPAYFTPAITANTVQFWGVQLEAGSVATPFTTATGTLQGELSACERYYERVAPGVTYGYFGRAQVYSSTGINAFIEFKTTKRVIPTAIDASGSFFMNNGASQANLTGSFTLDAGSTQKVGSVLNTVSSLTAGTQWSLGANNSAGAYIGFSAEL